MSCLNKWLQQERGTERSESGEETRETMAIATRVAWVLCLLGSTAGLASASFQGHVGDPL